MRLSDAESKINALQVTEITITNFPDTGTVMNAAIPARSEQRWAYLHSDSCSQFGVELAAPIMSSQACDEGFTNEVGLGGSIHFLKNSVGLNLIQECHRAWAASGEKNSAILCATVPRSWSAVITWYEFSR